MGMYCIGLLIKEVITFIKDYFKRRNKNDFKKNHIILKEIFHYRWVMQPQETYAPWRKIAIINKNKTRSSFNA